MASSHVLREVGGSWKQNTEVPKPELKTSWRHTTTVEESTTTRLNDTVALILTWHVFLKVGCAGFENGNSKLKDQDF